MRRLALVLFALGFNVPLLAASVLDTLPDPKGLFADRAKVHALVVALENEPLHKNALPVRALLVQHYKDDVDYLICGQVLSPLADKEPLHPVMFQMVIASGDWVEAHPDQARDIDAYTLAGLESGVRAYRKLLKVDAEAKDEQMEALSREYEAKTLSDWNKAHPCRPDKA